MHITDNALLVFNIPFTFLTKNTLPKQKKFIDLILQHTENEDVLRKNGLLSEQNKKSVSDN